MSRPASATRKPLPDDALMRALLEGVSDSVGEAYFRALVENLAKLLDVDSALVTEFDRENLRAKALALWTRQGWMEDYEYSIAGTPCELVFNASSFVHYPDGLPDLFPHDAELPRFGFVSYLGIPLRNLDGTVLGHLSVMDSKPMPEEPRGMAIFQLFAARASAEYRRLRTEQALRDRESQLSRLVHGVMDAIVEVDAGLRITQFNRAAEKAFGYPARNAIGCHVSGLLEAASADSLRALFAELDARGEDGPAIWVPGGLTACRGDSTPFPAEATVSRLDTSHGRFYTLVLRNIEERVRAAEQIQRLQEELIVMRGAAGCEIVGESPPLRLALQQVAQVAPTDATVLILGETGTGKEVFARAIHAASRRQDQAMVSVNCAAIPRDLIESEFFGHEKGAFTGATDRREGRFAAADGGTLFLDEIAELPLELQGKLLRVLQEGEFEPVGSSRTRRVNVRIVAATNRDLADEVKAGRFREDLYYRLNVFQLRLPPLRERGRDVLLLADRHAQRIARSMGRPYLGLLEGCEKCLLAHPWPGNVRELRNVIERALITSTNGRLDLASAFQASPSAPALPVNPEPGGILTEAEMRDLERRNILRALEECGGKVSGPHGAAKLLAVKPTTLSSRMKALGIDRP